ncbi:phage tail tape measure protein [Enterobacter hormaechei]|uniref:phage tail tape measure protein n=1 Tax=Enterobacter hormaechei TaxID=158836 RepID=UPI0012F77BF8|nr:phage tail tape measure protein [Enterobacter hormaechei]QGU35516.1 phage tail tape measure protein [Enterobacter hormaechei]QGU36689.1 phage tail tape measure protein [Enterobacter hormaechei]
MSNNFSVGVMIGGIVGSSFRSAVSGTRRALDSLGDTSRRLTEQQSSLSRAMQRYGQVGSGVASRLNNDLQRVGRTLEQLNRQQSRLSAASATTDALRANRMALYGQGIETWAQAKAAYSLVSPAIQQSATFDDKMIDMSITAKYDDKTRASLGQQIRGWSLKYNQYQSDLQDAVGSLISDNIDSVSEIGSFMPNIARAATATRTTGTEWAKVAAVWKNSMDGSAKEFAKVQNIMAFAGDQGSFEIPDQVKWMPSLAPMMRGIAEGKEAMAEIGASLQIARIGAGSSDEAGNNFRNFLTKIFARDTQKQFADIGIDLQGSLMAYKSAGVSPIEGMISVMGRYLEAKSPEALAGFKKAMKIKDDNSRDLALQELAKNFGLGEMFADMQVMAFVRPMLANMDKYREIRAGALKAADKDLLASSYTERLKSPLEATKALMVSTRELSITLGSQLSPSFVSMTQQLIPLIHSTGQWIAQHPGIVQGVAKTVGALLGLKIATVGLKLGLNLLVSPFAGLWKNVVLLRTNWLLLKTALSDGGKLRWLATGFSTVAKGAGMLGKALAGGLFRGVMVVAKAFLWFGRALLMNPIGIAITIIAGGAYLIYRNWGAISRWFSQRWEEVKTAFNGGVLGVSKLILNWSPLGLFYKAFAGVMKWFNIDLPGQFTEFGGHLIDGLVNGIKNKWESLKNTVTEMGDSVGGWFKEKLGIHSPSRVFMGFGSNIAEGIVQGVAKTVGALLGLKIATVGLKLGLNLLFSPFVGMWKNAVLIHTHWVKLKAALGVGGKLRWLATGFSTVAKGAGTLGKAMAGGLFRGVMVVAKAFLWFGRALLMNPIGIAISIIAGGAYLIYRNWGAISRWFSQRWEEVKTAFNGGVLGVSKLILNWSPLGLFYKAFAGVMKWFNIDLPGQFTEFGGHLIDGLVNGIKNKWESLKNTVTEMGDSVGGWFKEKLGIHSPSRVFMGFGSNIAEGAAIGIGQSASLALKASSRLAEIMVPDVPKVPPVLERYMRGDLTLPRGRDSHSPAGAGGGINVINNIYIDGKNKSPAPDVANALKLSIPEIERALEAILARKRRVAYD